MPRFTFSLEPLLTARRHAERQCAVALAALERRRANLENDLRLVQSELGTGQRRLAGRLSGVLDTTALRQEANTSRVALRRARELVIELAGVMRRIETARAELAAAAQARRAVEHLREQRYDAFRRRLDRAETAALDELAGRSAELEW